MRIKSNLNLRLLFQTTQTQTRNLYFKLKTMFLFLGKRTLNSTSSIRNCGGKRNENLLFYFFTKIKASFVIYLPEAFSVN